MHNQYRKYNENQGFLTDRLNRAKPNCAHRGGTPVQGLNLYTIKGLGPRGRFYGPGAQKNTKNFESRAKVGKQTLQQKIQNCVTRARRAQQRKPTLHAQRARNAIPKN